MPSDPAIISRIRGEYREMPDLRLTVPQASRLWQLDRSTSEAVIRKLVAEGFLARTRSGAFVMLHSAPEAL